jgi:hypothetical protein
LLNGAAEPIREIEKPVLDDLPDRFHAIESDPLVDAGVRARLDEIRGTTLRLRDLFHAPPAREADFARGLMESLVRANELERSLAAFLDLEVPPRIELSPPGLVPAAPAPGLADGGIGARPATPALPPQLEVVQLDRRVNRAFGSVKVYGKVRNITGGPIENARVLVIRLGRIVHRARLVPEKLEPGQVGNFYIPDGIYRPNERPQFVIISAEGQPIPTRS